MRNKNKQKRLIFIAGAIIISIIALIFIIINFRQQIVFFYSPSEMQQQEISNKTSKRQSRVGGLVVEKSVKKIDALTTEFAITDMQNNLKIIHKGLVPDLFREGQGVVAKGIYNNEENVFLSNELLVKHDEKYMPPEIAKSLKK